MHSIFQSNRYFIVRNVDFLWHFQTIFSTNALSCVNECGRLKLLFKQVPPVYEWMNVTCVFVWLENVKKCFIQISYCYLAATIMHISPLWHKYRLILFYISNNVVVKVILPV